MDLRGCSSVSFLSRFKPERDGRSSIPFLFGIVSYKLFLGRTLECVFNHSYFGIKGVLLFRQILYMNNAYAAIIFCRSSLFLFDVTVCFEGFGKL